MKAIVLAAVTAGVLALGSMTPAMAQGGCGPYGHRGIHGFCRPGGYGHPGFHRYPGFYHQGWHRHWHHGWGHRHHW